MKERQSPPARGELLERKIRFSIGKPPMLAVDSLENLDHLPSEF